jgi:hypothetical protein
MSHDDDSDDGCGDGSVSSSSPQRCLIRLCWVDARASPAAWPPCAGGPFATGALSSTRLASRCVVLATLRPASVSDMPNASSHPTASRLLLLVNQVGRLLRSLCQGLSATTGVIAVSTLPCCLAWRLLRHCARRSRTWSCTAREQLSFLHCRRFLFLFPVLLLSCAHALGLVLACARALRLVLALARTCARALGPSTQGRAASPPSRSPSPASALLDHLTQIETNPAFN